MLPTIQWDNNRVIMVDQRMLPQEEVYLECAGYEQVAEAIEKMVIRGAPAIGVAAAFGVALGITALGENVLLEQQFDKIYARLEKTRPTARNLFWALEQMKESFEENKGKGLPRLKTALVKKALDIESEDIAANRKIGAWGKTLIHDNQNILTYCNAGTLATAGYGTALGVVRAAFAEGKKIKVYAGETRPFLQGARLTVWELSRDGIPVVLIADNMAGYLMQKGEISSVITGADRIAGNGDTANKVGTFGLAVLAKEHNIPFYVAAPLNTIDFSLREGARIPIEERNPDEVRKINDRFITVSDVPVRNPAFDITPARFIKAIITEEGIARPPFEESLRRDKQE